MIKSKLPNVGTTIFSVMSKMANDTGAINLSQGFPGFPVDPVILSLVDKYMREGYNQYSPMPGMPQLREAIATKTNVCYNYTPNTETEICVTSGATEALFSAITALVNTGDEVIIFEPAYDSYIPAIELSGGVPVPVQLKYPNYSIDWNEVKSKITSKTKLIITNTPHNPTGATWTNDDIQNLKDITSDTDIKIISDEVYEHIVYDGKKHESIILDEELRNKTLIISSFGKTFHATGWKVGYCVAPEYLMEEFKKVHQFLTFSTSTPMQMALAEYMKDENTYLSIPKFYQEKRDYFQELIKDTKFEILPCSGTYFQLLGYKDISKEPDTVFAEKLCKEFGVASIPISVFYNNKLNERVLRFCFAKENEELDRAAEKLSLV